MRALLLKPHCSKQVSSYSTSKVDCSRLLPVTMVMIAVTAIPAPYSHSSLPLVPRSKMETWQTDFFFSSPSLLTLLLGSSFSLLSALSVPCAVWQCAPLLPWQGTLFHRCSRNLWPNVMLPLWANKMAQLDFRVVMMMMMMTEVLPFLKKIKSSNSNSERNLKPTNPQSLS